MNEPFPIREYEEAVYIFWFGPKLQAVKIGHTNDPRRRLAELTSATGVPGFVSEYAAVVWLDRTREKVEAMAHELASEFRRDGEWFDLTAAEGLNYVVAAAKQLGVRYEIEDLANLQAQTKEVRAEGINEEIDHFELARQWEIAHNYEKNYAARREVLIEDQQYRTEYLKQKWRASDGSQAVQHDHPAKPIWMWYRPAMGNSKKKD
jgi:hypothetical protein